MPFVYLVLRLEELRELVVQWRIRVLVLESYVNMFQA